ncbi:toxic anion resistance protein [Pseudactinotalea sp.]|uniref:toxic anion resistance protein n=1 Tax=Pseudactinotalea sp. TaxID=1926260 RepID=UPI003B3BCF6D
MTDQAAAAAPLEPPEAENIGLTLEPPAPVGAVAATQAPAMAPKVDPEMVDALTAKADSYVESLMASEPKSPDFTAKADSVRTMGDQDIRRAADVSNRLLATPVKEIKEGGLSESGTVGQSLLALRRAVEELDPSEASVGKKLLGFLPFGDKLTDYFRRYESAQKQLDAIIRALYNGQDELRKDNAALNLEKRNLWDTMGRLNQYIFMAERIDAQLSATIAELDSTDPERARSLREDVLFYVRQKHQDLLTQLAVSIQGYLAMDIIIKNNLELIKGVDRATTTTLSALRTAVIVAQALANQKLVLDQITALNTTTSNMIVATSKMLADNSASIQEQAASATIGIDQLQEAFSNIYLTLDTISDFKVAALDSMAQTVGVLQTETSKAAEYLERSRRSDRSELQSGSLDVGGLNLNANR